ncbi:delta-aminolevulinic acid dehydratase [Orientia chuto str. Dubai]|uniref:Delta-aminolevulinic acid dehydratase n=1 Tax=Orientia chuto str. Dubai TaxID=1359168 RepID=A0A0F3MN43_9RICK|nr:porphobilinogen synthase [Candidatus Orientia mediorientalis]KJV56892.1 delta-aminolevulinic acid dehydratase [Orientia chuto str. Dubai]
MNYSSCKFVRLRRNRQHEWLRDLVAETNILSSDLILPIFITEGINQEITINTMPSVKILSSDLALKQVQEAMNYGIKAVALFPRVSIEKKCNNAEEAYNTNNLICNTIRLLKDNFSEIGIIADVALDPYTIHGHDGLLTDNCSDVDNDRTLVVLCKQSLELADAGADIIAPSDMMDGRVKAIRSSLNDKGYLNTIILSYAVKYASNFYGPFRDAVGSRLSFNSISKKTYQMDYRNAKEAHKAVEISIQEGADMVMVKPAMTYLDIVYSVRNNFNIPVFAYQTSGEYSMIKHAALNGCMNFDHAMLESVQCIKRAGATAIFTYAALEIAKFLATNH